jgi:hypothetical protein
LKNFENVAPSIEAYFLDKQNHQTNPFTLDESLRVEIDSHWPGYMELFGYNPGAPVQGR